MRKIFVSYRRADCQYQADRLREDLKPFVTADEDVFIDIHNIPPGENFVRYLDMKVSECDLFFALIGPFWLGIRNPDGGRRLDDPNDFVRIEIASALKRKIRVVPLLLDNAVMPAANDLPEDLRELSELNGVVIKRDTFETDVERLTGRLDLRRVRSLEPTAVARPPLPVEFDPKRYVFISYPNDTPPAAMRAIVRRLVADGVPVWLYDPVPFKFRVEELRSMRWQHAAQPWGDQTLSALMGAKCVLVLLSKSSMRAAFQPREVQMALRDKPSTMVIVDDMHPKELPKPMQALHAMRLDASQTEDDAWAQANAKHLHMLSVEVRDRIANGKLDVSYRKKAPVWVWLATGLAVAAAVTFLVLKFVPLWRAT